MDQAEKKRKLLIGVALVATLIAVVLVEEEESAIDMEPAQPLASDHASSRRTSNNDLQRSDYLNVAQLGKRKFSAQASELFRSTSWIAARSVGKRPNPFAQAQAQAQAKARAELMKKEAQQKIKKTPPPLDFKYLGKVIEGNKTKVFLAEADEYHVVRLGERVNKRYRVDGINDEAVTLTYLPLGVRQKLMINEESQGMMR